MKQKKMSLAFICSHKVSHSYPSFDSSAPSGDGRRRRWGSASADDRSTNARPLAGGLGVRNVGLVAGDTGATSRIRERSGTCHSSTLSARGRALLGDGSLGGVADGSSCTDIPCTR